MDWVLLELTWRQEIIVYCAGSLLGCALRIDSCGGREGSRIGQREQFDCGAVTGGFGRAPGEL